MVDDGNGKVEVISPVPCARAGRAPAHLAALLQRSAQDPVSLLCCPCHLRGLGPFPKKVSSAGLSHNSSGKGKVGTPVCCQQLTWQMHSNHLLSCDGGASDQGMT